MDFDKYKRKMLYPGRLAGPGVLSKGDLATLRRLSVGQDKIAEHDRLVEEHRQKKIAYQNEEANIRAEFRRDAIEACDLTGHPRANDAFDMAWDDGHSDGYRAVFSRLEELSTLLLSEREMREHLRNVERAGREDSA